MAHRRGQRAPRGGIAVKTGPGAGAQRGFTLLEVIVAFGVLALALTLLLGTLSGATRQVRDADLSARAALHAQSLLDDVGIGERVQPGRSSGQFEDGRFRWDMTVEPWQDPDAPAVSDPGEPRLFRLALGVRWGGGGARERLDIESLRWVRMDAAGVSPP